MDPLVYIYIIVRPAIPNSDLNLASKGADNIPIGPRKEITSLTFEILQRNGESFPIPTRVVLTETLNKLPITLEEARNCNWRNHFSCP